MDTISKGELRSLMEMRGGVCGSVSIFMSTYKKGADVQQNRTRLKNLLVRAQEQLSRVFPRRVEAKRILEPARQLLTGDWRPTDEGLAMFLSLDMFLYYHLPISFEETVLVSDRFYTKPLIPLFSGNGRFYILAISQDAIRLLQGTRQGAKEIDLAGRVPRSLAEILKYKKVGRAYQYHAGAPGKGKEGVVFHGQGVGDVAKKDILDYFHQVDSGLRPLLSDEQAPLVLAGVDYLHAIYKKASSYAHIFDQGIEGNPEGLSPAELHQRAWALLEPHFSQAQSQAAKEYRQLLGTGHTSGDIAEVLPSAYSGGVELLFVALSQEKWGTFDPASGAVTLHETAQPCDQELLDAAAVYTLAHRGTVYAVKPEEMPENAPLAAVFRHEKHHPEYGHRWRKKGEAPSL